MGTGSDLGEVVSRTPAAQVRGDAADPEGPGRPRGSSAGPDPGELHFVLENDPALIPPLVERLVGALAGPYPLDEGARRRIELALHEAMLNGIYHGNLELDSRARRDDGASLERSAALRRRRPPYRERRLHVLARLAGGSAVFVIRDEGPGFDPATVPDPTAPANRSRPCGRGLLLIRSFMDEVSFNAAGNQVTLVKHLR